MPAVSPCAAILMISQIISMNVRSNFIYLFSIYLPPRYIITRGGVAPRLWLLVEKYSRVGKVQTNVPYKTVLARERPPASFYAARFTASIAMILRDGARRARANAAPDRRRRRSALSRSLNSCRPRRAVLTSALFRSRTTLACPAR